ncbi:MAG: radical SAM protein [Nitrospira sp.]|nr:radical SAM protein [bacterium]MBL7048227.1 radical SAM protein [Nitrospira sp.]
MNYSPISHAKSIFYKKDPLQLTLFLTARCNASCPFCFYLSEEKRNAVLEELSLEEIQKISASMGSLLWLAFSGGEIFLRKDIVEISETFYRNNTPSIMLFPTNGLLPDIIHDRMEEILNICSKSSVVVKLSIEGPKETHDRIRGKGSFAKTMETYRALKDMNRQYENFDLGINTVFSAANQDVMDELIESVKKMEGINTHTVSLIRGDVPDETLKEVSISQYNDTIKKLAQNLRTETSQTYHFRGGKLKAAQDIIQRDLIYQTRLQNRQLIPCHAGKLNLVITENGDLYPCEDFSKNICNIRDHDCNISQAMKTETARKVIADITARKCFCTHECYMMTNILFSPAMYPRLLKELIAL